jgi:hypothetical protein
VWPLIVVVLDEAIELLLSLEKIFRRRLGGIQEAIRCELDRREAA